MNGAIFAIVVATSYACGAFLALRLVSSLCDSIVPFDDGPTPGRPPTVALIVGAALVGGDLAYRGVALPTIGVLGISIVSLAACWYSDVRCGIVPDYFTLVPLGIVLGVAALEHSTVPLVSAIVVFVPFAIAAYLSKGRGMGWGDVKIVALGAAILGLDLSLIAFALAALVAVAIAAVRRRRFEPIAFAPYLAGSIALAIALPVFQ